MYQSDIDRSVDWAAHTLPKEFATKDHDGFTRVPDAAGHYLGECISYVKREFTHRTGEAAPSTGTGWADGWLNLPGVLKKYFAVEPFDRKKEYPRGSYVFWTPEHHIAIYLGKSGSDAIISHQNSPHGSGIHTITRAGSKLDMIMVPHVDAAPPAHKPTAPVPVIKPYTIEKIAHKQMKLKISTYKWNLKYGSWEDIKAHPVTVANSGKVFTAQAILHHKLGGRYYLEDATKPEGYNIVDCVAYVAPKPTVPAAPVPIPTNKDPYLVVTTLFAFTTSANAIKGTNAVGTVSPGKYMVFNRRFAEDGKTVVALNVTKVTGKPGSWINPEDNVPDSERAAIKAEIMAMPDPPEQELVETPVREIKIAPEPVIVPAPPEINPNAWKTTNQPLLPNYAPVKVVTNNIDPVRIRDLDEKRPDIMLEPYQQLHIVSVFQKDGVTYARAQKVAKIFAWYGIPWELVAEENRKLNFANFVGNILFEAKMLIQDIKKYIK